jgi:cell division protein FtsA
MQENSRYAVGIDVGTTTVRAIVAHLDASTGAPTVVGVGSYANSGMRKGTVVTLTGPAHGIDEALAEAERVSGHQVNSAAISINGTHILSTHADGMIAVGGADHEISHDDLMRVEEVATVGKVPPNREILEVVPHSYRLDGQDNIKDPLSMTGTRLEIDAHVVSVLTPHLVNLQKTAELAKVQSSSIVVPAVAAARAVLSEQQMENGVGLIDIGGATTNIAVYDEGDLQFTAVLPYGGVNITNDLAIGLKTDPDIAEQVKVKYALAATRAEHENVTIKHGGEEFTFKTQDIDDIVEARLEEIFEAIQKLLKKVGRAGKLPSGVVIVGGTAQLKGITEYAKQALGVAARVGKVGGIGGMADAVEGPQFAVAVGLMLLDGEHAPIASLKHKKQPIGNGALKGVTAMLSKAFGKVK